MAYKFQSGDATLSGSVTLVRYQDLLFDVNAASDIGTAAKKARVVHTVRQTASVGISGSAIYANKFYGNGAGITGISSDSAKTTGSAQNVDLDIVLVQGAGSGKTLAVDSNTKLQFNPSTNKMTLGGELSLVGKLSQSMGNAITGSQFLFRGGTGGEQSFLQLDGNGLLWADSSNADACTITYGGAISASSNANIGGTLSVNKNAFKVAADGEVSLLAGKNVYFGGDGSALKISGQGSQLSIFGANAAFNGNVIPDSDNSVDLGTSAKQWRDLYVNRIAYLDQVGTALDRGPVFATTLSASSTLDVHGATALKGTIKPSGVADNAFAASASVMFIDGGGLIKKDTFADVMTVAAGTAATTALKATSGVLSLDIANLSAEVIATGDKIVFNDAGDNGLHSETVDDLFTKGLSLVTETPIALANDYITFLDGGATGDGKKVKAKSFVAAMADGTTITSSNGVLSVVGAQNIDVNTFKVNNASVVLQAGLNYATASLASARTYALPASPANGDLVYVKFAALGGNVATLSGSGTQTIDGQSTVNVNSDRAAVSLVYQGSNKWLLF